MFLQNKYDLLSLFKSLNKLLFFGFIASFLIAVILAFVVFNLYLTKSRTFVPPNIEKSFTVSDTSFDENYAVMMAEYLIYLKLNVTPATVDRKYSLLLNYVNNQSWSSIQPQLVRESALIKKSNISSDFDVLEASYSYDDMIVKLSGMLTKSVGMRDLKPTVVSYFIYFDYENGELSFKQIKKGTEK